MAVSEPQRLALHRAAQAALGEEEGDTLMALSPPANTDMATRQDVEQVREVLTEQLAKVEARMEAQAAELKGDVKAETAAARAFTSVEVSKLATQIERTANVTLRWTVGTMLAGNAAVIAILGFMLR